MMSTPNDAPPPGGWTVCDLAVLPVDNVRRELIDGVLHVSPSPTNVHQVIAGLLMATLTGTCPDHLFVSQANDVRLNADRLFIPDVLVTTFEAARRQDGSYVADEVVLAVEIVSPRSRSMDRVLKPALYAAAGIACFWRVETDGDITVHTYRLGTGDAVYQPTGSFTDVIAVDDPWRIEIPVAGLRPRNL